MITYNNNNNNIAEIESFNVGDCVTVFYLREEDLERLRLSGTIVNKHKFKFKLFVNPAIIITFDYESPFIVYISNNSIL